MLLQFSVENFKSFRDRAVLSLEASADKMLEDSVIADGRDRTLKSVALFGANAAGKSNIFMALTAAILSIRESNNRQINEPLRLIVPFKLDPEHALKPTSFEFVFTSDGKKYVYGFSASFRKVIKEYLYVYHTAKATTVFERTEGDKYRFTSSSVKSELFPVIARNAENKLFLATATAWNCESTRVPYLWFCEKINTYSNNSENMERLVMPLFLKDDDGLIRDFTNRLLHEADINIDDYRVETQDIPKEVAMRGMPPELRNIVSTLPYDGRVVHVNAIHTVENNGTEKRFELRMEEESLGTRNLFMFSPVLKKAFETGETLCVDEFDSNLHPALVRYLLRMFSDPDINENNAQLIVSTHSMEILSLNILRRDQIYFVDKDRTTAASELYSLDEFSPRKDERIRKAYLMGRYGAVPNVAEA